MQPNASYFENLATLCVPIGHQPNAKAFFEIDDPDVLNNFDEALRNMAKETCMLLVNGGGELNDATSNNHTDSMEFQLYILKLKRSTNTPEQLKVEAKALMMEIVKRIKSDFRTDRRYRFTINNMPYEKVGPMGSDESQWYGYTTILRFTCPFTTALNSAIWTDI